MLIRLGVAAGFSSNSQRISQPCYMGHMTAHGIREGQKIDI